MKPGRVSVAFSLYLDAVRFAAAVAVLLDHLTSWPFSGGSMHHLLGSHGATAVTVFFVLSGFVIAYVTSERETTGAQYALSRISRLYSVVLPAVALTLLLDSIGAYLNPDFYSIQKVTWAPPSLHGYAASLVFVNEWKAFGSGFVPGSNAPFWSLSFEATYYVLAGLLLFSRSRLVLIAAAVILFLVGPTIVAMLPIWFLGFWLHDSRNHINIPMPRLAFILSLIGLAVAPFLIGKLALDNFGFRFDFGRAHLNRDLALDYTVAALFSVNLLAAHRLLSDVNVRDGVERVVRQLGATTFPLYAMHFPIIAFLAAIGVNPLLIAALTFLVVWLATPMCDGLKNAMRLTRRPVTA